MWGERSTLAGSVVRRQLRRLRRRWNTLEVGRAACRLIALGAGAATVVILLALAAPASILAVSGVILGVAVLGGSGFVTLAAWARWLGAERTPLWVDARCALDGLVTTLVALEHRRPVDRTFASLVAERGLRSLPAWHPHRLVPAAVPAWDLGLALATVLTLLVIIALAPLLRPDLGPVEVVEGLSGSRAGRRPGTAGRLQLGPVGRETSGAPADGAQDLAPAAPPAQEPSPSGWVRVAEELKARVQAQLWGDEWLRAAQAMAKADQRRRAQQPAREAARAGEVARRGRPQAEETTSAGADTHGGREGTPATPDEPGRADGGHAARGAGTGTDRRLFGSASGPLAGSGVFPLGLAANVRVAGEAPRPPDGEAPPAADDERPGLAARPREARAVHHPGVTPAYEATVRDLFAHRPGAP